VLGFVVYRFTPEIDQKILSGAGIIPNSREAEPRAEENGLRSHWDVMP
jgi:hypothetical protein